MTTIALNPAAPFSFPFPAPATGGWEEFKQAVLSRIPRVSGFRIPRSAELPICFGFAILGVILQGLWLSQG